MSSNKSAQDVAIKNKKKLSSRIGGMFLEVYLKEYDAQQRIGNSCCVFIKLGDETKFLVMADNNPEVSSSGKFFSIAIGASTSELGESKDILSELGGFVSETYSPEDFYPTVALYFLSRYLKRIMEEFLSPRALAVEYMILDPLFEILHAVRFSGDYESYAVGEVDKTCVLVGAYNSRLRRELNKEIENCLDKSDISNETLKKVGERFCKKYGLQLAAILEYKIVKTRSSLAPTPNQPPNDPAD